MGEQVLTPDTTSPRDVLFAEPVGLGLLRSAPAFGAALVAVSIGRRPIARHAGLMFPSLRGIDRLQELAVRPAK